MSIRTDKYKNDPTSISARGITIDPQACQVSVSGSLVDLAYIERLLLEALILGRGKVMSRVTLLEQVWHYSNVSRLETRTVDVHIGRLRKKLGDSGKLIITVRNVGYRMAFAPEWISR